MHDPDDHGLALTIERRALLTGVAAAAIMQLAPSVAECASAERPAYTVEFESSAGTVRKVYRGLFLPEVLDQAGLDAAGMILTDIWKGTGEPPPVLTTRHVSFVKPRLLPVLPQDEYWAELQRQAASYIAKVLDIDAPSGKASDDDVRQWLSQWNATYEAATRRRPGA